MLHRSDSQPFFPFLFPCQQQKRETENTFTLSVSIILLIVLSERGSDTNSLKIRNKINFGQNLTEPGKIKLFNAIIDEKINRAEPNSD